ncbi:cytochrome c-type biogenesis protein CcmH [Gammaproteobacteria bacterium]
MTFEFSKQLLFIFVFMVSIPQGIPGYADEIKPTMGPNLSSTDTAFQERMRRLEEELRCLVCQNQSLADSHADLAEDLRHEVEELARRGKSDQEIVDFLKERYGDFISYRPPFNMSTALLWISPFVFLIIALGGVIIRARYRRISSGEMQRLSPNEDAHARSLLGLDDIQNN